MSKFWESISDLFLLCENATIDVHIAAIKIDCYYLQIYF